MAGINRDRINLSRFNELMFDERATVDDVGMRQLLAILSVRHKNILIQRLYDTPVIRKEIGKQYSVTSERIRQIECKALRILRRYYAYNLKDRYPMKEVSYDRE